MSDSDREEALYAEASKELDGTSRKEGDSKLEEIFTKLNVLREDIEFNVEDLKDLEKTVWNAQDSIEELKNEIQRLKNEIQRLKDKEK